MTAFDWPALMCAGLTRLRLRPEEFWRLTPIEFLLLAGYGNATAPTTRETLDRLSRAFPDERETR